LDTGVVWRCLFRNSSPHVAHLHSDDPL